MRQYGGYRYFNFITDTFSQKSFGDGELIEIFPQFYIGFIFGNQGIGDHAVILVYFSV